jgi:XTP/dITP diphosphohydrolase
MPLTLYVATSNPGKLRDFSVAAQSYSGTVEFAPLPGLERIAPPPEDAPTFEENARDKAIFYSNYATGCMVLADDSGLEVDSLGGAPGARSARYAADAGFDANSPNSISPGPISADERNNLLLLENMRDIPVAQRTARYRCVLAAAQDGKCIALAEGSVEGMILEAPRGSGGFGYDPLFYFAELHQTMAEIDLEQKLQLSHRGHALRALLRKLSL